MTIEMKLPEIDSYKSLIINGQAHSLLILYSFSNSAVNLSISSWYSGFRAILVTWFGNGFSSPVANFFCKYKLINYVYI